MTFKGWRKSSRSTGHPNNCVEIATAPGLHGVRDSKNPDGAVLAFPANTFATFLHSLRRN